MSARRWRPPFPRTVLERALALVNESRLAERRRGHLEDGLVRRALEHLGLPPTEGGALAALQTALDRPDRRLAVYGSLVPGQENHHLLAHLEGEWLEGFVRGDLPTSGRAAARPHPAMTWSPSGSNVPAHLLESEALPEEWERLDEFEGMDFLRILVPFEDARGVVAVANLYQAMP